MMKKIEDGGTAFPCEWDTQLGMNLRDYFAAQALSGMLSAPMHNGFNALSKDKYAKEAYWFADAMVKARNGEAS